MRICLHVQNLNGNKKMNILTGTPISTCEQTKESVNGDGYLIARQTHTQSDYYVNNRIDYEYILESIGRTLSSYIRLGSMAYELSTDYSFKEHEHSYYNKIVIGQNTQPQNYDIAGKIIIGTEEHLIYVMKALKYKTDDPELGEIKFIAANNIRTVNITSDNFDGWVYANGTKYQNIATNAVVYAPKLDDFFVCTTESNVTAPTNEQQAQARTTYSNPIKEHKHVVSNLGFGNETENITIKIPQTYYYDIRHGTLGMHGAESGTITKSINVNFNVESITFQMDKKQTGYVSGYDENHKTHPSYNYVQAMIYIGKGKWRVIS